MTRTPRNNPTPTPPTSRDGIDAWLDVLTSMLALPPSQRAQVRDELEDHLRSRVDDLLIAGSPEPEAVRTAIAELGETAQLARHITSANHTPKSFRRFAMNATFFVLAGSILTASVSMMMPNAPQQTVQPHRDAADTAQIEQAQKFKRSVVFDINEVPFGKLISQVVTAFGLEQSSTDAFTEQWLEGMSFAGSVSMQGEYTLDEAIEHIRTRLRRELPNTKLVLQGQQLKLLTVDEYKRSLVQIKAYPMPTWAESDKEQRSFAFSIEQLLIAKHDLEYTTIQPVNATLVVAAPPEVHAEINNMAAQLKVLAEEMRANNNARREQQRAAKERQLKALEREYEMAKAVYIEAQRKLGMLRSERQQLDSQRNLEILELERPTREEHKKVNAVYAPKMDLLDQRISEFHFEVEEAKARFERLQSILIDAEADLILSGLNNPISADTTQDRTTSSPVIYIAGPGGVRSGTYHLPESGKLTLSRFLTSANAHDAIGNVTLERDGNTRLIGTTTAVLSGEIEPITLLPDDRIVISAAD